MAELPWSPAVSQSLDGDAGAPGTAPKGRAAKRRDDAPGKARIIEAAIRLFARQGYSATSIDAVAKAAEVSRSLIFWHFDSKEALLWKALDQALVTYNDVITQQLGALRGLEALAALVQLRGRMVSEREALGRLTYSLMGEAIGVEPTLAPLLASIDRTFTQKIAAMIREGQENGDIIDHIGTEKLAVAVMSMFHGNSLQWLIDTSTFDVVQADQAILDLVSSRSDRRQSRSARRAKPARRGQVGGRRGV